MGTAEKLAAEIADLKRRLRALERAAQMPRTSIDGGALVVNDETGQPVLRVGKQEDGSYVVTGENGGTVVANEFIAADPDDGSYVHIYNEADEDGAVIDMRPAVPGAPAVVPATIRTGTNPHTDRYGTVFRGPNIDGHGSAEIAMTSGEYGGELSIESGYWWLTAENGCSWVVNGDWEVTRREYDEEGEFYRIFFQARSDDGVIYMSHAEVDGALDVQTGPVAIGAGSGASGTVLDVHKGARLRGNVTADADLSVGGRLIVAGRDQGSGKIAHTFASTSQTGIGTSNTVTEQIASVTLKAGRAYRVETGGGWYGPDGTMVLRDVLVGGTAATGLMAVRCAPGSIVVDGYACTYIRRTAASDLTTSIAVAARADTGTVNRYADANLPRWLAVYDCGDAAAYPWAKAV